MRNDLGNRLRKCPSETASEMASVNAFLAVCHLPRELPGQMSWFCGGHRVRSPPRASSSGNRDRPSSSCHWVVGTDPGRLCVDGRGLLVVQAKPGVPQGRRAAREHISTAGESPRINLVTIIDHWIRNSVPSSTPGPCAGRCCILDLRTETPECTECRPQRPSIVSGRITSKECRFLAKAAHLSEAPGGMGRRKAAAADDDAGGSAIPLGEGRRKWLQISKTYLYLGKHRSSCFSN